MRETVLGVLFAISLVFAAACGTPRRLTMDSAELLRLKQEFVRQNNAEYEIGLRTILARMELEVAADRHPEQVAFDMLIIHGGGPKGGFAAGSLQGWGEVAEPAFARPRFDHITGSSSGALVAPFAFLGDDDSYRRLYELALDPPFRFDDPSILAFWPKRGAVLSNDKLKGSIEGLFDPQAVAQLAYEADEHRSLLIATTDLDLGLAKVWDITYELARHDRKMASQRLHQILLASTAMPVFFPPVKIDGHLHGDGGIAATAFVGFDIEGIRWVANQWKQRHPGVLMPPLRVWVIFNEKLFVGPRTIQPRILDVGVRSLEIMMEYDRFKALLAMVYMFKEVNDLEGVRAEFLYVVVPEDVALPVELSDLSDNKLMHDLVERGRTLGADPGSWSEGAPELFFMPEPRTRPDFDMP